MGDRRFKTEGTSRDTFVDIKWQNKVEGKAVYLAEAVLKITTSRVRLGVPGVLKDEPTFAPRDHNKSTIICSMDAHVCRTNSGG